MQMKHLKTLTNLLLYAIGLCVLCFLLPRLLHFFMPFVIGWIIALLANPLVRLFEKKIGIVRKHGTWIVIIAALTLVIGICYVSISWMVNEISGFVDYLPEIYASLMQGVHDIEKNMSGFIETLPPNLQNGLSDIVQNMDSYLSDWIGSLGKPTLSVAGDIVGQLPNLLIQAVFMFLSAYFFIADKEKISSTVKSWIPKSIRSRFTMIKEMFSRAVLGYFKAQLKIMVVIAAILFLGFLILRIDYAILWAILIAILDFIPFLGTGTAIWPWALFQFLTGDYYTTIGLMIIYFVCLLVHQLLQPKFIGDTVGMDPLTTLIFMFIGYRFSSVIGMIVAIPIGIILINLYKAGAFDRFIHDIQELIQDFNQYRKY